MPVTDETYLLLTTFRKSGEGVPTAIWIAALPDGSCGFTTEANSGKVKRIRNNPAVTLQPCDVRGRVKEGSAITNATAEVLLGEDAKAARAKRARAQAIKAVAMDRAKALHALKVQRFYVLFVLCALVLPAVAP